MFEAIEAMKASLGINYQTAVDNIERAIENHWSARSRSVRAGLDTTGDSWLWCSCASTGNITWRNAAAMLTSHGYSVSLRWQGHDAYTLIEW